MQYNNMTHILFMQVYDLLKNKYHDCPWPVPPCAILMHLPVKEEYGQNTSEARLRKMLGDDKRWRRVSPWTFSDVHPPPEGK